MEEISSLYSTKYSRIQDTIMEYLVVVTLFFAAANCASAYIEDSPMRGRKASQFGVTDWSPQTFTPKIRIRPLGEAEVKDEKINVDAQATAIIRREYGAWANRHGKEKNEYRFGIFKKNFVLQMEMNRKNNEFFLLNEFGDLTKEEYIALLKTPEGAKVMEQNELQTSYDPRASSAPSTLRAAPIQKIEDMAQSVLDSAMESSRKSIAEEKKKIIEARRKKEEEYNDIAASFSRISASDSGPLSYFELLNAPMQPLDTFVRRPTLMSGAVSSVSETFRYHLIMDVESKWEDHAYAMDFGNDEEYSYDYNENWNDDYAAYAGEEAELYDNW